MEKKCYVCMSRVDIYKIAQKRKLKRRKALPKHELYKKLFGKQQFCDKHSKKEEEEWKIVHFASKYEVSDQGRLRNLKTGYIHKVRKGKNGYVYYLIRDNNGRRKPWLAHRIVALVFIDNPDNLPEVDHIDRDKMNNKVENLRWSSSRENKQNRIASENKGGRVKVVQLSSDDEEIKVWDSADEAVKQMGRAIGNVLSGRRPTAAGFKWKYHIENIEDEQWKKIPIDTKFEYYASNKGRIKSTSRRNKYSYGTLSNGYYRTQLIMQNGKVKNYLVSRLVLLSFIGEPPEDRNIVNHKDCNKTDNCLENLEYVTHLENCMHASKMGLLSKSKTR